MSTAIFYAVAGVLHFIKTDAYLKISTRRGIRLYARTGHGIGISKRYAPLQKKTASSLILQTSWRVSESTLKSGNERTHA
jgi:hypothetical protein